MFEARLERCKQLARERGDRTRAQTGVGGMRRPSRTACAANNAKGGAGGWQGTDDQGTKPCFKIERAEQEPAFARLVYPEGSH
jgi:hypothetical protein